MPDRSARLLALIALVAVTGCSAGSAAGSAGSGGSAAGSAGGRATPGLTAEPTPATGAASPSPAPAPPGSGPAQEPTLAFAGDIHFEDYLAPVARAPQGLAALRPLFASADLSMANLETAITERGTRIGKEFHFRAPASALQTLADTGLDVLTQANNHGVDFGPVGLEDTLAAREASPIPIVGIGKDEQDAFAPHVTDVNGLRVAVFGADQVYEMTLANFSAGLTKGGVASSMPTTRIVAAVKAIRDSVDVVVVYLHWGTDYQQCPDGASVATARDLEAAGADVIVGAHSHRVNGSGWLGRAYVAFGLGNFVWWRSAEPDSRTGVLTLTLDREAARAARPGRRSASVVTRADWTPLLIGRDGIPAAPPAADGERLHRLWEQARACTGLAATPD